MCNICDTLRDLPAPEALQALGNILRTRPHVIFRTCVDELVGEISDEAMPDRDPVVEAIWGGGK